MRALSAEAVIPNLSDSVTLCCPGDAGGGCSWWVGTACWLDWMTSGVFANLNGSIILWRKTGNLLTSISAKALPKVFSMLWSNAPGCKAPILAAGSSLLLPLSGYFLFMIKQRRKEA